MPRLRKCSRKHFISITAFFRLVYRLLLPHLVFLFLLVAGAPSSFRLLSLSVSLSLSVCLSLSLSTFIAFPSFSPHSLPIFFPFSFHLLLAFCHLLLPLITSSVIVYFSHANLTTTVITTTITITVTIRIQIGFHVIYSQTQRSELSSRDAPNITGKTRISMRSPSLSCSTLKQTATNTRLRSGNGGLTYHHRRLISIAVQL